MPDMRTYPQKARDRIAGTKIINRLMKHIHGEIDMSPSQVQAARILLNKVLPDLKSLDVQASIEATLKPVHQLSDDELLAIAGGKVVRLNPPAIEVKAINEAPVIESTAVNVTAEPVLAVKAVNGTQGDADGLPTVRTAPAVDVGF